MRTTKRRRGFFLTLLINLLLNLEGLVPAILLAALHFLLGWPFWLVWVALGLWIAAVCVRMWVFGWLGAAGNEPTPYRPNKNPYSVGSKKQDNEKNL